MTTPPLFDVYPKDWKHLQECCALLLGECGFSTEIEKSVDLVRGKAKVDVYAKKMMGPASEVICECKYWESAVPQNVIHAFRTVILDSGASHGYIISKKGFQQGAHDAVIKSNVTICTWEEFQEKFNVDWLSNVIERNYKKGRELMRLSHELIGLNMKKAVEMDDNQMQRFYEQKESDFHFFTFKEHYLNLDNYELSISQINESIKSFQRRHNFNFSSYRAFFNTLFKECQKIIDEWRLNFVVSHG